MSIKLVEHTYGNHVYMKMRLDNRRIEEIDVYYTDDGTKYFTSADYGMVLNPKKATIIREQIIAAFNELY